jgi:hypothetical protein
MCGFISFWGANLRYPLHTFCLNGKSISPAGSNYGLRPIEIFNLLQSLLGKEGGYGSKGIHFDCGPMLYSELLRKVPPTAVYGNLFA